MPALFGCDRAETLQPHERQKLYRGMSERFGILHVERKPGIERVNESSRVEVKRLDRLLFVSGSQTILHRQPQHASMVKKLRTSSNTCDLILCSAGNLMNLLPACPLSLLLGVSSSSDCHQLKANENGGPKTTAPSRAFVPSSARRASFAGGDFFFSRCNSRFSFSSASRSLRSASVSPAISQLRNLLTSSSRVADASSQRIENVSPFSSNHPSAPCQRRWASSKEAAAGEELTRICHVHLDRKTGGRGVHSDGLEAEVCGEGSADAAASAQRSSDSIHASFQRP